MRNSRFGEEQKAKMLREVEQSSVVAVAKKHGVSIETIYRWRRSFGGMEVADVKRLKKLLAERD
jgi:putative transposase